MNYAEIKALVTPEFKKDHKIPMEPIQANWKDLFEPDAWWSAHRLESGSSFEGFAKNHGPLAEKDYADFQKLHAILLSIGGFETCFPCCEEDMAIILDRAYYRKGTSKMMVGRASKCHSNCANLWENNRHDHDVRICTGYALSEDGLWRQHTWLVHCYNTATQNRVRVIETTCKRVAYYGVELTEEEAEEFSRNNFD